MPPGTEIVSRTFPFRWRSCLPFGDQRMSREEALESYTRSAAYAAKEEALKGSLEVGKLADITILSKDLLTVPDDEIRTIQVTSTIVGGKVAYKR